MLNQTVVSAFVGRSFAPADEPLWRDIRDIFESFASLGFRFEDAKATQLAQVSEKVKEGIERNELYVGILTQRHFLSPLPHDAGLAQRIAWAINPSRDKSWTGSEWIVEEVGYALGRKKKVLLLKETAVLFPPSDLDADTEWVEFDRKDLSSLHLKFNQALTKLFAGRLVASHEPAPPPSLATTAPLQTTEITTNAEKNPSVVDLIEATRSGDLDKGERLYEAIVKGDVEAGRPSQESILLAIRARHGDEGAYSRLTKMLEGVDSAEAAQWIARLLIDWGKPNDALALIDKEISQASAPHTSDLLLVKSSALRKLKRFQEAIDTVRQRLQSDLDDQARSESLEELENIGKDSGDAPLEVAALERLLETSPLNHRVRFRAAFLYDELARHKASAFHYQTLINAGGTDMPSYRNNLAVSLGKLGIKGEQVSNLMQAMAENPLAKANLAFLYVEAGFYEMGEKLAKEAIASDDEEGARRAQWVLSAVAEKKDEELAADKSFEESSRPEREFRAQFAHALASEPPPPITALATVRHVPVTVKLDEHSISGSGTSREILRGLGRMVLTGTSPPEGESYITRNATFAANLIGRSGTYTYEETSDRYASPYQEKGLLILSKDLNAMTLLVLRDDQAKIQAVALEAMQ